MHVGVLGCGAPAMKEAGFLRSFTEHVTIIATSADDGLDDVQRSQLSDIGVHVVAGPAQHFKLETDGISLACSAGQLHFDSIYPALGSIVHSELAVALGANVTTDGCIKVDAHQRTNVPLVSMNNICKEEARSKSTGYLDLMARTQLARCNAFSIPVFSGAAVADAAFWASAASSLLCSVSVSNCLRECSVDSSTNADGDLTSYNF